MDQSSRAKCPKCGGSNISYQIVQTGSTTKAKSAGCLWSLGRAVLVICTCGLWLIIGKRRGTGTTSVFNKKMAICQSCGKSWNV
ncbi:MAG: hypothetical protein FWF03_03780 [Defluviitaleaceae bacterium]|nr:hypothetical protein [Defluviitaleaceae bacterium]